MPATVNGCEIIRKRRNGAEISDAKKKRRKVVQDSGQDSSQELDIEDGILGLEGKILESRSNYNSIRTLLEYMRSSSVSAENNDVLAAVALCRVFCRLMVAGSLAKSQQSSDNEVTIVQWLKERLKEYENNLLRMLCCVEVGRNNTALTLLMRLVKEEALHLNKSEEAIWRDGIFPKIIQRLLEENVAMQIRLEFAGKYLEENADVRHYTFARLA
jgi:U3 small nucleolar RNA-associated protein 19